MKGEEAVRGRGRERFGLVSGSEGGGASEVLALIEGEGEAVGRGREGLMSSTSGRERAAVVVAEGTWTTGMGSPPSLDFWLLVCAETVHFCTSLSLSFLFGGLEGEAFQMGSRLRVRPCLS